MTIFISICILSVCSFVGLFLCEEYNGVPSNVGIASLIAGYLIYLVLTYV